jgi:hypothetical protein
MTPTVSLALLALHVTTSGSIPVVNEHTNTVMATHATVSYSLPGDVMTCRCIDLTRTPLPPGRVQVVARVEKVTRYTDPLRLDCVRVSDGSGQLWVYGKLKCRPDVGAVVIYAGTVSGRGKMQADSLTIPTE